MKMEKQWCLYSDENQTKLFACVYEEDHIDFESQYYTNGFWFEYDIEIVKYDIEMGEYDSEILINERKYKKKVRFPDEALERPKYGEDAYDISIAWSKMKESMGTADVI
jgi:hypothetical protein